MKLEPIGSKLLVEPKERNNFKTDTGIEIVQAELNEGTVVEVSKEFADLYFIGDVLLFSAGAGVGEYYNGKSCIWIDGRATNLGGDVWSKIVEP